MIIDNIMIGQLSDEQFKEYYPNANVNYSQGTAITYYGSATINYWKQHLDRSWTNYNCRTNYWLKIF
jgi:hypothetical protein